MRHRFSTVLMDCADLQHSCFSHINYVTNLQIIKQLLQRLKSIKIMLFYTVHPHNQMRNSQKYGNQRKPSIYH